jgi:hypothetical protein
MSGITVTHEFGELVVTINDEPGEVYAELFLSAEEARAFALDLFAKLQEAEQYGKTLDLTKREALMKQIADLSKEVEIIDKRLNPAGNVSKKDAIIDTNKGRAVYGAGAKIPTFVDPFSGALFALPQNHLADVFGDPDPDQDTGA